MSTTAEDRTELISEVINALAGPVTSGLRAAGQINQRRLDVQQHLEESLGELRRMSQVVQRLVNLLDELEGPIRDAIPQVTRATAVLREVLDQAPDDIGTRLASTLTTLNGVVEGLGPMAVMAQGMFGQRGTPAQPPSGPAPSGSPRQPKSAQTTSTSTKPRAKKVAATTTSAKKVTAKKVTANKVTAKKDSAKKGTTAATPVKKKSAKKAAAPRR